MGKVMGLESKEGMRQKRWGDKEVQESVLPGLGDWRPGLLFLFLVASTAEAWTSSAHRFLSILLRKAWGKAQNSAKCFLDGFLLSKIEM